VRGAPRIATCLRRLPAATANWSGHQRCSERRRGSTMTAPIRRRAGLDAARAGPAPRDHRPDAALRAARRSRGPDRAPGALRRAAGRPDRACGACHGDRPHRDGQPWTPRAREAPGVPCRARAPNRSLPGARRRSLDGRDRQGPGRKRISARGDPPVRKGTWRGSDRDGCPRPGTGRPRVPRVYVRPGGTRRRVRRGRGAGDAVAHRDSAFVGRRCPRGGGAGRAR
jgi:hypothetical protein